MKKESIERIVEETVEGLIVGTQLELVDVEFVRERDWYLRIYLDKPGGVDLDDCQLVTERLSAFLDTEDPIKEKYLLEVSSPGLDRVLKKEKDFVRYQGRVVDLHLFQPMEGSKLHVGTLAGHTDTEFFITIGAQTVTFPRASVSQMRLHLDF